MKRASAEVLRAIGHEVRRRRHVMQSTLEDLAERAHLHRNYISKIELGQADLSISALWSLAMGLGCDVADLLPSAGQQEHLAPAGEGRNAGNQGR